MFYSERQHCPHYLTTAALSDLVTMTHTAFIALDIGTHAVRACSYAAPVAQPQTPHAPIEMGEVFSRDIGLTHLQARWIEQSPEAMKRAVVAVLTEAAEALHTAPAVSQAIRVGMAVQRSSVLAWQRDSGEALCPILSWQDTRGFQYIEQLSAAEREAIKHTTGLQPSPHYGASKLAWLRAHLTVPNNADIIYGPLAAWLIKQLTGNNYCDPVNAGRTLLFNLAGQQWDKHLCDAFNIPCEKLPQATTSVFHFGDIIFPTPSPAALQAPWASNEQKRYARVTPQLTTVLGDQNAAYIAMRYGERPAECQFNKPLIVNIGSGAFVLGQCDSDTDASALGLLKSVAFNERRGEHHRAEEFVLENRGAKSPSPLLPLPPYTRWLLEGTVNSAGTAFSQWREGLNEPLTEAQLFQQLPHWLMCDDFQHFYINTASGLGSPFWLHNFTTDNNVFFNLRGEPSQPTRQQQACAIVNSIAFLITANILQFQRAAPHKPYDGIVATGGLARVSGLVERIASLCQLPIFVTECHEATLQGTAILCSEFLYKPSLRGHIVADKKSSAVLLDRYRRYIRLINTLAL
ncbi:MAG TPA: FGGY family carbohydrate kinase [Marinagarivorans sp.]